MRTRRHASWIFLEQPNLSNFFHHSCTRLSGFHSIVATTLTLSTARLAGHSATQHMFFVGARDERATHTFFLWYKRQKPQDRHAWPYAAAQLRCSTRHYQALLLYCRQLRSAGGCTHVERTLDHSLYAVHHVCLQIPRHDLHRRAAVRTLLSAKRLRCMQHAYGRVFVEYCLLMQEYYSATSLARRPTCCCEYQVPCRNFFTSRSAIESKS